MHQDLTPANFFITDNRVSGVIDFGNLIAGDPRYDIAMWLLYQEPQDQISFIEGYGELANDPMVVKYLLIIIVNKILFTSTTHKKDDKEYLDKLRETSLSKLRDILSAIK